MPEKQIQEVETESMQSSGFKNSKSSQLKEYLLPDSNLYLDKSDIQVSLDVSKQSHIDITDRDKDLFPVPRY